MQTNGLIIHRTEQQFLEIHLSFLAQTCAVKYQKVSSLDFFNESDIIV